MADGFFDVESRGAFQAFQELRGDGAHLLVVGAHDGVPAGSGGSDRQRQGVVRPLPPRHRQRHRPRAGGATVPGRR